jgi:hypothetical protein
LTALHPHTGTRSYQHFFVAIYELSAMGALR